MHLHRSRKAGLVTLFAIALSGCNSLGSSFTLFNGTPAANPNMQRATTGQPDVLPLAYSTMGNETPYQVLGQRYDVLPTHIGYKERGNASWFGLKFEGKATANGEIYDSKKFSAAHKTLPIPSFAKVTNLANGKSVTVRINDRGPYYGNRLIDVSYAAAQELGILDTGVADVMVEGINANEQVSITEVTAIPGNASRAPKAAEELSAKDVELFAQQALSQMNATQADLADANRQAPNAQPKQPATSAGISPGRYLQVGAYSQSSSANKAKQTLERITNYPIVMQQISASGKSLIRVVVGPFPANTSIEQVRSQIQNAGLGRPFIKMLP